MWDYIIDVNLKGNFLCAQSATRAMMKTGGGKIIIVLDSQHIQTQRITAYAAAKGSLRGRHDTSAALELGPYHINVNCIAPGPI